MPTFEGTWTYRSYVNKELDTHKSDYGMLATIITDVVPDKHTKRLTVLIPPVNFPGDVGGAFVTSQAIISTEYVGQVLRNAFALDVPEAEKELGLVIALLS